MAKRTETIQSDLMTEKIKQVLLEKHRLYCSMDFPMYPSLSDHAQIHTLMDFASMSFRVQLRTYMLQNLHAQDTFHEVPATWWDHFKLTHFPLWALIRYPVVYKKLAHNTQPICPHMSVQFPDNAKHIRFLYYGKEDNIDYLK